MCGRVDVFYGGRYGTVCDDGFDIKDARVICRQLGYPRGAHAAYTCGNSCRGRGLHIWLNNINCRGSERDIAHCPKSAWGRHNCGHNEDAGVCCNGEPYK